MAIIKQSGPKFDIGSSVSGRIQAIQKARSAKRLSDEARFLRTVSETGMSYDDQLSYREGQLSAERGASAPNQDFINELTKDIASLRTLAAQDRFSKEYADSFDEVTGGRKSLESHVAFLEDRLAKTTNPQLASDIRQKLSQARADLRSSDDTVLENFITYATNSKQVDILDQAITRTASERAKALASGDDDYASVLQLKEQSLRQARSTAEIEFKTNQLKMNSVKNPHPVRTLDFFTKNVADASDSGPVIIDGKRYDSERDYWTQSRASYVADGQFFSDLKDYYGKWINNALEKNPELVGSVLMQSKDTFGTLATRPELAGFEVGLQDALVNTVGKGVRELAKSIIDNANTTYDFQGAADRLADLSKQTGIDLSAESNALIRNTANVRADSYQAVIDKANELEAGGMNRAQASAEALRLFQSGELVAQPVSPKALATTPTGTLIKESETAKPTPEIKVNEAPVIEERKPLETTTTKVTGGVETPVTQTSVTETVSSTTTVTPQQPSLTPKKMVTLFNQQTGDRQTVEAETPKAQQLGDQGYLLESVGANQ